MSSATDSFSKDESPAMPGGPYTPVHPTSRKIGYAITGVTIAVLGTFGNGLVSTNLNAIGGEYGLYSAEATWLTIAYTSMGATASLFLIKGRQQFGIDRIIKTLLFFYAGAALLQMLVPDFATAIVVRGANGLVTSTGVAMAVYYILEILPKPKRAASVPIILGTTQLSAPLSRMVPVELLTRDMNRGQHLLDIAVPLIELALIYAWPLPPTPTYRVFERLDVLTVALLLPGLVLLVAVLALGRAHWWIDTPWLGWLLVFVVPLVALGTLLELGRSNPALRIGWMTKADMLRFAAVAFFERIAVSEQSYGAVGLLSATGLDNDQLHGLFALVIVAMIAGIAVSVLTLGIRAIGVQIVVAILLIGIAAWIDSFSNGLTRVNQLLATQAMVGFGTTLFVGPALLWGVLQVMQSGPRYLLSLVMVFSFTQNIGSLTGSALLSSYQYGQSQAHARVLEDSLDPARPQVAAQIAGGALAATAIVPSLGAAAAAGVGAVTSGAQQQSEVLGFLDTFRLVTVIAFGGAMVVAGMMIRGRKKQEQDARKA